MYDEALPLTSDQSLPRIYAQSAYSVVRSLQVAPIVAFEALSIAATFPIAWQRSGDDYRLVALRTLGKSRPPTSEASLPLLLRAFPIRNTNPGWESVEPGVDLTPPDMPSDIGAPIFQSPGILHLGASHRVRSLVLFATNFDATVRMSEVLRDLGMFEPWDLTKRVPEAADLRSELFVARKPARSRELAFFLSEYRQMGAMLLSSHRLSMFRTGVLVSAERSQRKGDTVG